MKAKCVSILSTGISKQTRIYCKEINKCQKQNKLRKEKNQQIGLNQYNRAHFHYDSNNELLSANYTACIIIL